MKLKGFKAKAKRDASPMRGKENQEMGGLGSSNLKGPGIEFTGTTSSHQTPDASTSDPVKNYDINPRTDPSLINKAHTDPPLNKMGGIWSSEGIAPTLDALLENLAGARNQVSGLCVQGKLTDNSIDVVKSESSVSTVTSQESLFRHLGYPGPDRVGANYRAFDHIELSPRLEHLKNTDLAAYKIEEMRFEFECQAVYRSAENPSEEHPNHPRVWTAKNLWCSTCTENCAVCGASCCARSQALQVVSSTTSSLDEKAKAQRRLDRIQRWVTVSMDETTFLMCTECNCFVCPSCCGLCPHPICRDLTCKKCKEDPWTICNRNRDDNRRPQIEQFLNTKGHASNTAKMRTYDDTFSGDKIYPGKGKLYVRGDSKIFRFQNGKTESLFLQRKNPRRIAWTTLYRRQHKKGISEEIAKKRTRRTVKHQRAIVGASLDVIKERRTQRPEARAAARQAAIKEGKEKKSAAESKKKAEKAKTAAGAARGQVGKIQSKMGAKGAPNKVNAKSR